MSGIRNLVPYAASFGPQENDENHFFTEAELGEVFTVDKSFPPKTIHALASKYGWGVEYCAPGSVEHGKHGHLTYKIVGKSMDFMTVTESTNVDYSCVPLYFGKYVYVQISASSYESVRVGSIVVDKETLEGSQKANTKKMKWGTCVSKEYFDKKISEHGLDPSWAIRFWEKDMQLIALTPRQLKRYSEGYHLGDEEPDDVLDILRRGDTKLLVRKCHDFEGDDEYTAFPILRDVDWKPIYREFAVRLYGKEYDSKSLLHFLRERDDVRDEVLTGRDAIIMFTYIPSNKTFKELAEICFDKKSFNIPKRIEKILGLEKFKND